MRSRQVAGKGQVTHPQSLERRGPPRQPALRTERPVSTSNRVRRWAYRGAFVAAAFGLAATGLWGYRADRDSREQSLTLLGATSDNRIDLCATIQRIDPAA